MAQRKIILRACADDAACGRAREFVPRVAAAVGVGFELQWFSHSSGYPLPQVFVWDGELLETVDDEVALTETLRAKRRAEEAAEEAARKSAEEWKAKQDVERRQREAQHARGRGARRARAATAAPKEAKEAKAGAEVVRLEAVPARAARERTVEAGAVAEAEETRGARPEKTRRPRALPRPRSLWPRARTVIPFAVPLAIAALAWALVGDEPEDAVARARGPVAAPRLDLPTLDGFRFDLGRELGRAVLVVPFDGQRPDRAALARLAAGAEAVADRARGAARVVAVGVGAELGGLRTALRDPPHGLAIAVDGDGRAMAAFAAAAGTASWWVVARDGRVVAQGTGRVAEGLVALGAAGGAAAVP